MKTRPAAIALSLVLHWLPLGAVEPQSQWAHTQLLTKNQLPDGSTQQTSALVADLDKDGLNDFVISFRQKAPALVWYRHAGPEWQRVVIDKDYLTVEAGGAAADLDGDGDLDLVFGADWQGTNLWWWENPYPKFDSGVPWKRHIIKNQGAKQHHDQVIADFKGAGKPQLVFWNQGAKTLFLADIPAQPAQLDSWPYVPIFSGRAGEGEQNAARYAEGLAACDIDGDGKLDLLAGNYWFKHQGQNNFKPIKVGKIGGCILGGRLKKGRYAQIVISPGDGVGPLIWYDCTGDPEKTESWQAHELLPKVVHGHSLQLGDVNGDGNLDIFCAEMAKWGSQPQPDNPTAKAWIFYGDGQGKFTEQVLVTGHGWHEARLADLDGDGDLDLLNKPYTWEAPKVDIWYNHRINQPPPR